MTNLACQYTQTVAKTEALALVGAELYTERGSRKHRNFTGHSLATFIAKPVKRRKFRLPMGTAATNDEFGRPHVVPQWYRHAANEMFLNALYARMTLVKVSFLVLYVELKS